MKRPPRTLSYDAQMAMYDMEMVRLNGGNQTAPPITHAQSSAHDKLLVPHSRRRQLPENPIELMLMAQLDSPRSITQEDRPSS